MNLFGNPGNGKQRGEQGERRRGEKGERGGRREKGPPFPPPFSSKSTLFNYSILLIKNMVIYVS